MQRITKLAISYGNATTFTLTTEGISPSYDAKPYQPEMLQEAITIWKQHFGTLPLLSLPTPESVNITDRAMHLANVTDFVTILTNNYDSCSTLVLSGLLFDVASLLAIEEKLAADHA